MKYSIIITTYKRNKLLQRCLNGFKKLNNCEIIIVNDDPKKKYVKNDFIYFQNIKIINSIKNNGPSISRNIGIEKAIGEYIYIMDDDDYPTQEFISFLNENKFTKLIYRFPYRQLKDGVIGQKKVFSFSHKKLRYLDKYNTVEVSTFLIKKSLYKNNKVKFENNRYYWEDAVFFQILWEAKIPMYIFKDVVAFIYDKTNYDGGISRYFDWNSHINSIKNIIDGSKVKRKNCLKLKLYLDVGSVLASHMTNSEKREILKLATTIWNFKLFFQLPPHYISKYRRFKKILEIK